jgi:cell division septation protein DedD
MERWMRTSLLNLDQPVERTPAPAGHLPFKPEGVGKTAASGVAPAASAAPEVAAVAADASAPQPQDNLDFEIVFGRRQVASTGLVLMVVLACFSGVSYLIGRSAGAKAGVTAATAPATAAIAPQESVVQAPAEAAAATADPATSAPPASTPATVAPGASKPQAPLFAEAISGQVYIQVGAIDKSLAGIWAEGLRTHGLDAFVAAGPSDKMWWRVLIGPLPDPQSYQRAKNTLDGLGITTFGRKYSEDLAAPAGPAQ